jgi:hypothetical protein
MRVIRSVISRSFKNSFQLDCIDSGKPKVGACERRPFFQRPRRTLEQMGDGKARPQHCSMAAIEGEELIRVTPVKQVGKALLQILCRPGGTEPLALDAQECDFVERIDHA